MSQRDDFIAALTARGYVRMWDAKTRRYVVMKHPKRDTFVYVGKSGGVRVGTTVTGSFPMSDVNKQHLLDEAKKSKEVQRS